VINKPSFVPLTRWRSSI